MFFHLFLKVSKGLRVWFTIWIFVEFRKYLGIIIVVRDYIEGINFEKDSKNISRIKISSKSLNTKTKMKPTIRFCDAWVDILHELLWWFLGYNITVFSLK